ncbi:unnamed protein product, partial [Cladocopium goreaui]
GLLAEVEAIEASAVLGDVYPHDAYTSRLQQKLLQDTHRMLLNTSVPLLRWLPALDDGQGRWHRDHMEDAGHPNSLGHQVMFEAIDLSMFDPSNANSLSGSSPRLSSPASREASPQASEAVDPPADPERTLLETSGDVGTEPLPATENPAAAEPATEDVALPVDEGDEGSVPRPPVEITSGWDVFNPDDQLEHTIPTGLSAAALPQSDAAATAQDGWGDFDFDALM